MTEHATMLSKTKTKVSWESLANFAVRGRGSVDPKKFPEEDFDLFSIPAYESGAPDRVNGSQIGSAKKNVLPGDVLISRIVPHIQRVWVVPEESGRRQIASGEWLVFRRDGIFPNYLRHMLLAKPFHSKFMQTVAGVGGSLLRARPAEVERLEIPIPRSKADQERIASILDMADAIRSKREALLRISDTLLHATFLEMFGDPSSNPYSYEQKKLGEVARFTSGGTPSKKRIDFWGGDFPWVSPKDMKVDLISDAEDHVTEAAFMETSLKEVATNTPLIVVRGMILAHTVPIAFTQRKVAINQDMKAVNFNSEIDPVFGFWSLKVLHERILSQVDTAAHGTKRIDMARLEALPVLIPGDNLQREFVCVVQKHGEMRARLQASLTEAKTMCEALSQRAFRGEL